MGSVVLLRIFFPPIRAINPRRVNGSGVETLFGQLKHATGGKAAVTKQQKQLS